MTVTTGSLPLECPRDYSLANHPIEVSVLVGLNILSCLLGTVGNLLVFMAVYHTPGMNQTSFHYFITSLAVADLIVALIAQPLLVVLIAGNASSMCLPPVHYSFRWVGCFARVASQMTLVLISLDRCLTVAGKFNYNIAMTAGKKAALVVVWLFAFTHASIRMTVDENMILFLDAIAGVTCAFYAFILYQVCKYGKQLPKSDNKKQRNSESVTVAIDIHTEKKLTQEIRVALTLMLILVCLTVSWLPILYHTATQPGKHYGLQYYRTRTCSSVALTFNPFIYCFRNRKYRKTCNEFYGSVFGGVAWKKPKVKLKSADRRITVQMSPDVSTHSNQPHSQAISLGSWALN